MVVALHESFKFKDKNSSGDLFIFFDGFYLLNKMSCRPERPEWNLVGLIGQVHLLKSQRTNPK